MAIFNFHVSDLQTLQKKKKDQKQRCLSHQQQLNQEWKETAWSYTTCTQDRYLATHSSVKQVEISGIQKNGSMRTIRKESWA